LANNSRSRHRGTAASRIGIGEHESGDLAAERSSSEMRVQIAGPTPDDGLNGDMRAVELPPCRRPDAKPVTAAPAVSHNPETTLGDAGRIPAFRTVRRAASGRQHGASTTA